MSDSTSFPLYQPLNPERHEVRLLRILGQTETITCTLETTSFDTSPIYSALSYEWAKYQGEDPGEHVPQIVVNSLPISVTTNLSLALKYLNKDRGLYWIDALCINQEDDEERGHQVRMMARIYQSAERVHAWLGLSDDGSTLGMLLLSDFLKDFVEHRKLELPPPENNEWALDWVRQKLRDPHMYRRWKGLGKILDNSYWNRLWIVQELVVPETPWIVLKLGFHETVLESLNIILGFVSQLEDVEFGGFVLVHSRRMEKIFSKVTDFKATKILQDARSWRNKDAERMGFLNLLRRYFTSGCSNPRDRAYALLEIELGKEGFDLEINYSAPLDRVFLGVAKYIIQRAQRLDILGLYKGSSHVLPLPSWVPDWQLSSNLSRSRTFPGYSWMDSDYDASAKSTTLIGFSHGGTVLKARCILLGPITICSIPNWIGDGAEDVIGRGGLQLMGWLAFCASSLHETEFEDDLHFHPETLENLFTAFYETVVGGIYGRYATGTWPLPEFINCCKCIAAALRKEAADWEGVPWTKDQLATLLRTTTNHLQLFSVEIQERTNQAQSSDPSINLRKSRKSIGRGDLRFANDGDIVAIVHGCKLPILLRKEDLGYRVLSGLFVYGFMNGEAIGQYSEMDIDFI